MDQASSANFEGSSERQQEFNDLVGNILMSAEELRRSLTESPVTDDILMWRDSLEHLLSLAEPLARWTSDAVGSPLETDMYRHCQDKIQSVAQQAMQLAVKMKEPDPDDPYIMVPIHAVRTDGQAAIARIAEINLMLAASITQTGSTGNDSVSSYVAYQRQVLRQRAKPSIARLVQVRREGLFQRNESDVVLPAQHNLSEDDDDDDETKTTIQQYHAPALADILGQAAALIHPLILWLIHLPPDEGERNEMQTWLAQLCRDSIQTLNSQAQELSQTISTWFWEDRPMEEWMNRTTSMEGEGLNQTQLAVLDGLVEEMAFACQVHARYLALFSDTADTLTLQLETTTLQDQLLPEFTWKYASLERYLALQQWQSAVAFAIPVPIVMGTNIHVPSVVEDAQYLSTRALERAALTESKQAIGTVAHAISHDVWSTEVGGVFAALIEEKGCWTGTLERSVETAEATSSPPRSGFESGFVSALMDALDEDEPSPPKSTARESSSAKTPLAPNSGKFLLSIVGSSEQTQQLKMDADLCMLNGFHAACGACRALVTFLDSLLPSIPDEADAPNKTMDMIRLAREELYQYASTYENILEERILSSLNHWCGSVDDQGANWEGKLLPQVRVFFEVEEFLLDEVNFEAAEKDERLAHELIEPMETCVFLRQLSDKSEPLLLGKFGKAVVESLVRLILDILWNGEKALTDWGALLLSKEVRLLQKFCGKIASPISSDAPAPNLLVHWEKLLQVICILQLEKPADWLTYSSTLTPDEVHATMRLRTDFSPDAIQALVAQLSKASATTTT